jgi:hypothetical protein
MGAVFFSLALGACGGNNEPGGNNGGGEPTASDCGNSAIDAGEVCDGAALAGATCESQGFASGSLSCSADCGSFDTTQCSNTPNNGGDNNGGGAASCGNDVTEAGELCDGSDLGGSSCADFDFDQGDLQCLADCSGFDTSACSSDTDATCGDAVRDDGEECDGSDFGDTTCATLGLGSGTLSCNANCTLDTAGCDSIDPGPLCGDGVRNGTEECDGADLGSATCEGMGAAAGSLACAADCTYDLSGCGGSASTECGNGVVDGLEA